MLSSQLKRIIGLNNVELATVEGNLLSAAKGAQVKTVFVTSCRRSEGKTTTAVAVAHALATTGGAKVLLVDGNQRAPKVHQYFEMEASPGLSEVLAGKATIAAAMRATEFERLTVLPYGAGGGDTAESGRPEALAAALGSWKTQFDYVIFDGDSALASSGAVLAAKHFDGVVFVVECEKTKWEVLELAKEKIANVGGNILGVVLNRRRFYIPRGLYGKI
jgi:capsular exopolysaccharide synthesis family protein